MITHVSHSSNEEEIGCARSNGQMTFKENSEYIQPASYKIQRKSDVSRNQSVKLNSTFTIIQNLQEIHSQTIDILLKVHAIPKLRTKKRKPNVHV